MTPREIINEVAKHIPFFREKDKWPAFCQWADATARQCHKYLDEQDRQAGDYYRLLDERRRTVSKLDEARDRAQDVKLRLRQTLGAMDKRLPELRAQARKAGQDPEIKGWVKHVPGGMSYDVSYDFFSLPFDRSVYTPPDFTNPVAWVFGYGQARPPTDAERLLCDCVLLTVLHDTNVEDSEPHILASETMGQIGLFKCGYTFGPNGAVGFIWSVYQWLGQMRESDIERAWNRVQPYLLRTKTPEQTAPPSSPAPTILQGATAAAPVAPPATSAADGMRTGHEGDEPPAGAPSKEPLSVPMNKKQIMAVIGLDKRCAFTTWAKGKLRKLNRQSFQVRLNLCAPNERAKFEQA